MGTGNDETGAHSGSRQIDVEDADWSSLEDWKELPSDPDLHRSFGYATTDWEVITPADGTDQLIFLPSEEEVIREEAFVIADEDAVCDLRTRY